MAPWASPYADAPHPRPCNRARSAGEFYSDGTLGPFGKFSNLAVGGWGWVVIGPSPTFALLGGEYGTLEGEEQTVPRAELRAVLSILSRVPRGAPITIKVDASYLLGFSGDPDAKCRSDNGDLWLECWKLILGQQIQLNVVKIARSHATDDMVLARTITEEDRVGNHWADKYAKWGAELIQPQADQVRTTALLHAQAR